MACSYVRRGKIAICFEVCFLSMFAKTLHQVKQLDCPGPLNLRVKHFPQLSAAPIGTGEITSNYRNNRDAFDSTCM